MLHGFFVCIIKHSYQKIDHLNQKRDHFNQNVEYYFVMYF